jgi:hypothetical protein
MEKGRNLMVEARKALALHPKCGAKCKQRDGYCVNPAMKNGRCYIHGGKSTGPATKHGQRIKATVDRSREIRQLLKNMQLTGAKE